MKRIIAYSALLITAGIWGCTFVVVKDALDYVGPFEFIAIRMMLAAMIITVSSLKTKSIHRNFWPGVIAGLWLFGGYGLQTIGLQFVSPSRAAFLTGLYVVLIPIGAARITNTQPPTLAWIAAITALIGTAGLTLPSAAKPGIGDVILIGCALCFALQILTVGKHVHRIDPSRFVSIQLWLVAALSLSFAVTVEGWVPTAVLSYPMPVWTAIIITSVFSTSFAFWAQAYAQKLASATHVGLIYATEPVFATIYSTVMGVEVLTLSMIVGGTLILAAMIMGSFSEQTPHIVARK